MLLRSIHYRYRPLAIVLVVFFSTSILCHMYISRAAPPPSVSDIAYDLEPDKSHHREKYITFLPHSGLHNQRIALINAMILALETRRTLILPELNMGAGTYWHAFQELETKINQCPRQKHPARVRGCSDYQDYVPMSVEDVFNLDLVHELGVRTIQRPDMRPDYFERALGIAESDMYRVADTSRYTYQILDSADIPLHPKFHTRIDLDTLVGREEKLIFFGSLFGTSRVKLRRRELAKARRVLQRRMGPSSPGVRKATESIVERLGGPLHFTSIHLRLGDGPFRDRAGTTQAEILHLLEERDKKDGYVYQADQNEMVQKLLAIRDSRAELLDACTELQAGSAASSTTTRDPRLRLIYLATDVHPRSLADFSSRFVCIFTLNDFVDHINSIVNEPLLMPLVDAEVAAQAAFFIPTAGSTFSSYINHRHHRFAKSLIG